MDRVFIYFKGFVLDTRCYSTDEVIMIDDETA
jgi:hypothetical protein